MIFFFFFFKQILHFGHKEMLKTKGPDILNRTFLVTDSIRVDLSVAPYLAFYTL